MRTFGIAVLLANFLTLGIWFVSKLWLPVLRSCYRTLSLGVMVVLLSGLVALLVPPYMIEGVLASGVESRVVENQGPVGIQDQSGGVMFPALVQPGFDPSRIIASSLPDTVVHLEDSTQALPAFGPAASSLLDYSLLVMALAGLPGLIAWAWRLGAHSLWRRRAIKRSTPCPNQGRIRVRTWKGPACSCGVLRPLVLLPEAPETDLAVLKAHELAHARLGHGFWQALQGLSAAWFWYNPCARFLAEAGEMEREIEADRKAALDCGTTRYARALVENAGRNLEKPVPPLVEAWDSHILTRLGALNQREPRNGRLSALMLTTFSLGLGVICYALPLPPPASSSPGPVFRKSALLQWDVLVSFGWGPQIHPLTKKVIFHQGVDLCVEQKDMWENDALILRASSSPVLAWNAGVVTRIARDDNPDFGLYVDLDHGDGLQTRYAHLGKVSVRVGDNIARSGEIGCLDGNRLTHLHFELSRNGKSLDPEAWVDHVQLEQQADGLVYMKSPEKLVNLPHRNPVNSSTGLKYTSWFDQGGPASGVKAGLWIEPLDGKALPVQACMEGTVVETNDDIWRGKRVKIYHQGDWASEYAHLARVDVVVGDMVKSGDVVGLMGQTGAVTHAGVGFSVSSNIWNYNLKDFLGLNKQDVTASLKELFKGFPRSPVVDRTAGIPVRDCDSGPDRDVSLPLRRNGVDFLTPVGEAMDIHAWTAGKVVALGDEGEDTGLSILIAHGAGWSTRYSGLSETRVKVGDLVSGGEVLGVASRQEGNYATIPNLCVYLGNKVMPTVWLFDRLRPDTAVDGGVPW